MIDNQTIEMVQVRWDSVVVYKMWCGSKGQTRDKLALFRNKAYSGVVQDAARKRLLHSIDLLIQFSRTEMIPRPGGKVMPFRLAFVTLTVPGAIRKATDVHVYFKRFLDWLRSKNALYIWKAEYQKRGQVHYHLIVNKYIPWAELKYAWNSRLKKGGFLNSYAKKKGHFMPNSVDVRSVKSSKALSIYLAKYLTKKGDTVPAGGLKKWWGASSTLLGDKFRTEMWSGDWDALQNGTERIEDPDGRWMVVKGKRNRILSAFTNRQYKGWMEKRRSASWQRPKKQRKGQQLANSIRSQMKKDARPSRTT